ncbi:hypothetical protein M9Y10_026010 [Tritrichomonas musculus]|uniref:Uncharacterized protein n=1 Tax=Tritrichomonas musculus TaxID=1915356 RepID=A0ABR2H9H4_9EUKA
MQCCNNEPIYATNDSFRSQPMAPLRNKETSSLITIYVFQPGIRIRHIKLDSNNCISILYAIYPNDSKFIFKGQILDISKTFLQYQINNENKIVLISPMMIHHNPFLVDRWLKITNDQKSFEERINLNVNKNSRLEIARLKDIKLLKLEVKRKKFDKYLKSQNASQYNSIESINKNQTDEKLEINYKSIDSPSIDPLPIIW